MSISIRRITCREAWENPEWPAIVEQYKKDVQHVEYMPDVDEAMYFRCELSGMFYSIGAFDGENLVGVGVSSSKHRYPSKRAQLLLAPSCYGSRRRFAGKAVAKHLMKAASDLASVFMDALAFTGAFAKKLSLKRRWKKCFGRPAEVTFWQQL